MPSMIGASCKHLNGTEAASGQMSERQRILGKLPEFTDNSLQPFDGVVMLEFRSGSNSTLVPCIRIPGKVL